MPYPLIQTAFTKILLSVVTVFLLNSGNLSAQTASDTLRGELESVTIEATLSSTTLDRATMSVSTLRRSVDDIVSRRAATMDELTFTLPGVWVNNRENHALGERMTVRGMGWRSQFGLRGVQVILDDIPLTVADGQSVLNMVDPAMVTSIELLRGPSATYWGNSSGGVLYLKTGMPTDSPNLILRSYMGSYNTMKQELRLHETIGGVRWNGYGSYYKTDGFRDFSAATLVRSGLSAGFDLGSRSTLDLRWAYSGMPDAQHPGYLSKEAAENTPSMAWPYNVVTQSGKEFHQTMGSGIYLQEFDAGHLSVSSHIVHRDMHNPLPGPYIIVDRWAGGSRSAFDFNTLPFELQVGGELKWQRDDREQYENTGTGPGDERTIDQVDLVTSQSLFGKALFDFDPLSLSIGIRGDRMSFSTDDAIGGEDGTRIFTSLNPSVGLNLNLQTFSLFASASSSFESPTTTEFKNRPGGGTGFNPNLDPEKTHGVETGIRGTTSGGSLSYDLAVYGLFVKDQIVQESIDDGVAIFSNGGDARHRGFEAHVRFAPVDAFSLEFMYSLTDASFTGGRFEFEQEYEGNKIPGLAPHRIGSSISLDAGRHTFSTDVEWVGEYYTDSANSVMNDSYLLLDGRWTFNGLQFDGWGLQPFISVNNITDTRYNTSVAINSTTGRYFEPGSGRNFTGGISLLLH